MTPQAIRAQQIRNHFVRQAQGCDALGSPFTATLCRAFAATLDRTTRTGTAVLSWPTDAAADALSLRLCGALHALMLSETEDALARLYPPHRLEEAEMITRLPAIVERFDERLLAGLDHAPQTNEVARSAMLLPGFTAIARETGLPIDLHEIGASAGLNLLFDRFCYRYADTAWGEDSATVRLAPEVRGLAPPLDGEIRIVGRQGCDIAPIDIADPAARLRLRSYIWADQAQRLARLDAALAIADASPPRVARQDAALFLEKGVAGARSGSVFALYHSIMWQYLPGATKTAVEKIIEAFGRTATPQRPVAWLRMEPLTVSDPFATLSMTLWPGGRTRHLARCDYHGRWIEWLA